MHPIVGRIRRKILSRTVVNMRNKDVGTASWPKHASFDWWPDIFVRWRKGLIAGFHLSASLSVLGCTTWRKSRYGAHARRYFSDRTTWLMLLQQSRDAVYSVQEFLFPGCDIHQIIKGVGSCQRLPGLWSSILIMLTPCLRLSLRLLISRRLRNGAR